MITIIEQESLLDAKVEALVNPVNCVGVMGKGLALEFKLKYPKNYKEYKGACERGVVEVGRIFPVRSRSKEGLRWVINFPTKKHWKDPSRYEWIEKGLSSLHQFIYTKDIKSIAIPLLGCGNGGLNKRQIELLILEKLGIFPDVEILLYH